jgi:hypothetical protein
MRKFRCDNPEKPGCSGEMRVVKTKTLNQIVLRLRKCSVCGHKIKTREQIQSKESPSETKGRPKISFSELQRQAILRKNNQKKL